MGIILKRMMVRTASMIAERYKIQALVTGEVLGQVSSQTLSNLKLIDNISNKLILRPIISYDKEQIIKLSKSIGTESFSKNTIEYCALLSKKSTSLAKEEYIIKEENNFNFSILEKVVNQAKILDIRKILTKINEQKTEIKVTNSLNNGDIVLDIRTQEEQEKNPLILSNVMVQKFPFYKLANKFNELDKKKSYLLYCNKGMMSYLQASFLYEQGFHNVKIYNKF